PLSGRSTSVLAAYARSAGQRIKRSGLAADQQSRREAAKADVGSASERKPPARWTEQMRRFPGTHGLVISPHAIARRMVGDPTRASAALPRPGSPAAPWRPRDPVS